VLLPWLRLGHRAGVVRIRVHACGVGDLVPQASRVGAVSLFETPDSVVRTLFTIDSWKRAIPARWRRGAHVQ